jgi:hypothetical protein
MKIISHTSNKKVITYKGCEFGVQYGSFWIAIDMDGALNAYADKPIEEGNQWVVAHEGSYEEIAHVEDFGDWKESLEKI